MSGMPSIATTLDDLTHWLWVNAHKALECHVELEGVSQAAGRLFTRNNALVTLYKLHGSRSMVGTQELDRIVEQGASLLNNLFTGTGHALHVVFERDPGGGDALISNRIADQKQAARHIGLDLEDLFDERARRLAPLIAAEHCYIALWTHPSCLLADQLKRDDKSLQQILKTWTVPRDSAQRTEGVVESLVPRHSALEAALEEFAQNAGFMIRRLEPAPALAEIRTMLNGPLFRTGTWHPDIPGAGLHPPRERGNLVEGVLRLPLAEQLIAVEPVCGPDWVRLGERVYCPLDVVGGPRESRPFSEVLSRAAEAGIPLRFSLLIEGGGLGAGTAIKRAAATIMAFSNHENRLIRDALQALSDQRAEGEAIARIRMTFATWAAPGDDKLRRQRQGRLLQAVESWGEMSATALTGDALETMAGTVPGMACCSTAEAGAAPLRECLKLMPFQRPASGDASGDGNGDSGGDASSGDGSGDGSGHMFRSRDGKLLGTSGSNGSFNFDLVYGRSGQGKSVLLNSLSLAFCHERGLSALPFSATIDIGPTSEGLISLIRESLPANRRHEVGYYRLTMTETHAINPFDTQLGLRKPLPDERAFLVSLVSTILTRSGEVGVVDGLREAIGPTIDAAYIMRAGVVAGSEPHPYQPGRSEAIDKAITARNIPVPDDATWWDVVDLLFEAGSIEAAGLAQRFAVPVMIDLVSLIRADKIENLIGEAVIQGGEAVTSAFIRIMVSAASNWPNLCHPTRFDLAGVRVAAIDLADVTPQGSAEADRQTAIMYLVARHVLVRHWWFGADMLEHCPPLYRAWHRKRIDDLNNTPKRLCYDEFHRTAKAPDVQGQIIRDVRETRKRRAHIILASQLAGDFSRELIEQASRFWILGSGGKESEVEEIARVFELSAVLKTVLQRELNGPTAAGAPVLSIDGMGSNRTEHLRINTLGPIELWALNTNPRDVSLRNRLYTRMGATAARAALARQYPAGGAEQDVERRMEVAREAGKYVTEVDVLDDIAAEIIETGDNG